MEAPALAITPLAQVSTAPVLCRLGGALWATVVVKATFQLVHGEDARLVAPIELVREDRANAQNGSLIAARETTPHLPAAGVLLTGHACAPEGRDVTSMSVRLGVSRDRPVVDKTLHVFGQRLSAAPSVVAPFRTMPLVYERAFGGAGIPENPVGAGGPGSRELPNIVDPKDPRRAAGFGPIAGHWMPRRALLGGVDAAALGAPVLEVPAGFDWRYFQPAPPDQQVERLRGDEWILLDGMSARLSRVQSRLPRVMAAARKRVEGASGVTEQGVELRADMLVIDADRLVASLVWRGRFMVESPDALERTRVLVGLEQPGRAVEWPRMPEARSSASRGLATETAEVDLKAILGGAVPFAAGRESALPPPGKAAEKTPLFTGTSAVDVAALVRASVPFEKAQETAALPALRLADQPGTPMATGTATTIEGIPALRPESLPFRPAPHGEASGSSTARPRAHRPPPMSTGTTDINLADLLKPALPLGAQKQASGGAVNMVVSSTPLAAPVEERPYAPPAAFPVSPPPLLSPAEPSAVETAAAKTTGAGETAPAPPPELRPASAEQTEARAQRPPATGLARSRAVEGLEAGRQFDGEDFESANLSGLDLSGRSLARCNLRAATLRGTKLMGADLSGAVLDEADLRGAALSGANLRDASAIRANFERASLAGCDGEGANLTEANLAGADCQRARLTRTTLTGAVLRDARANRANLDGADMTAADLTAANLQEASLRDAILVRTTLDGADLRRAVLEGANLEGASRRTTKLAGATLSNLPGASRT